MNPFKPNDPQRARRYFEDKMSFTTGPVELARVLDRGDVNVVDVRAEKDFEKEHIPNARNLPRERWSTLEGLTKDKLNVLVCYSQVCHLAATAAVDFASRGYSVMELEGGFKGWKEHHLPLETGTVLSRATAAATAQADARPVDGPSAASSERHY